MSYSHGRYRIFDLTSFDLTSFDLTSSPQKRIWGTVMGCPLWDGNTIKKQERSIGSSGIVGDNTGVNLVSFGSRWAVTYLALRITLLGLLQERIAPGMFHVVRMGPIVHPKVSSIETHLSIIMPLYRHRGESEDHARMNLIEHL